MGQAHGRLHAGGARGKASSAVALAREDDSCAICLGALQKPRTLSTQKPRTLRTQKECQLL